MKYRVGQELYSAWGDELEGKCGLDVHIVRTIRGNVTYAIRKVKGVTWVKKSKKHFDWGWADYIQRHNRSTAHTSFLDGKFMHLCTTKRQAWMALRNEYQDILKEDDLFDGPDDPEYKGCEKIVATAKRRMKAS